MLGTRVSLVLSDTLSLDGIRDYFKPGKAENLEDHLKLGGTLTAC